MPRIDALRARLARSARIASRFLWGARDMVALKDLLTGSSLGGRLDELAGRAVLVATADQITTALALIELDGVARRLLLLPSDVKPEHLPELVAGAGIDAVVSDRPAEHFAALGIALHVPCRSRVEPCVLPVAATSATEWILLTSGTTGAPKMVVHDLAGLTAAIKPADPAAAVVWGTFYDIRRYGGLQIFFRAITGEASFVLSSHGEAVGEHLARLGRHGATHVSGTPSHWRRVLMGQDAGRMAPNYVRLSGEIADQAVLDSLRATYPHASVGHAYASTEAGVGFEVNDGREGFPASLIGGTGDVEMKVLEGSLRIRSTRTAARYLDGAMALMDGDGFVDTGDLVELRDDRYYFIGRRGGIINVGGLKVHPEEVEAVINRHPSVRMSQVRGRKNAITGAIVVAEVVPTGEAGTRDREAERALERDILEKCRAVLPEHKVPAAVRIVASLEVSATGKLIRGHA